MSRVSLRNVRKEFSRTIAVRDLSLEIPSGELLVLVGPSGCGKSTTLRLIAGLEAPTSGEVLIDGRPARSLPPKDRNIAMVFQNHALYPHLSARANIAFGLRMRRTPRAEIGRRVRDAAELLGIDALLDRKPGRLSGGEQQRIALARALVREPRILLLDEPLSNLDVRRRTAARAELRAVHQRLGTTTIHVTHDQEEAMALGQRLAVMHEGAIQQIGEPMEVYRRPANRFVASFVGSPEMNLIEGALAADNGRLTFVSAQPDGIRLPLVQPRFDALRPMAGRAVTLGIRAGDLHSGAGPGEAGTSSRIDAQIEAAEPLGDRMDLRLRRGNDSLVVRVPVAGAPAPGDRAAFAVDMERVHLFESGAFGRDLLGAAPTEAQ